MTLERTTVGVEVKRGLKVRVGVAVKAVTVTWLVLDCTVPLLFVKEAWLDKDPVAEPETVTCTSKV